VIKEDNADMGRLKILATGSSPKVRARTRATLFDAMMIQALHHYGYRVHRTLSVNSGAMGIDVEGKHRATGLPCYAECRFSDTRISAPEFQAFYGKFMTRWHKDKNCHGLFIALPGIDSAAHEFYREYIAGNPEVTTRLYEESDVFDAVANIPGVVGPESCAMGVAREMGKPGNCFLLTTEKGIFWAQYITSHGEKTQDRVALFDARGNPVSDPSVLDYLTRLHPELDPFETIAVTGQTAVQPSLFQDAEEISEVQGGSEFFDYQLPASPKNFVGAKPLLERIDTFVFKVINKESSHRGLVFEANSGWGKSSAILASVSYLREKEHFSLAIDSRTVSPSKFIQRVVDYTLKKFGDFGGRAINTGRKRAVTGFEDAVEAILDIGKILERHDKLLVVFLDQLETIFILPDALNRIRDLFLAVCESQSNVVFGFAWKQGLIGLKNLFSKDFRNDILSSSEQVVLDAFSKVETNAFTDRLSGDLNKTLRKDLRFSIAERSQGYPWLLKKLCAHVKDQLEAGTPQANIAKSLFGVETLFQNDLDGLSGEAKATLLRMAGAVPFHVLESGETYSPDVVHSLLRKGFLKRTGNILDVYGDIFRNFLVHDVLPIQENYILLAKTEDVFKATKIIRQADESMDMSELQRRTGLSEKAFYCIVRDMDLTGLAKVINGKLTLQIKLPSELKRLEFFWRRYLQERFRDHRLIQELSNTLKAKNTLPIGDLAELFEVSCPYLSATKQAWTTYSNILARWMDAADLALLDRKNRRLIYFDPKTDIRERHLLLPKRRGAKTAHIQYSPVERIATRLVHALHGDGRVDWTGLSKHTIFRSLAVLEDLEFIVRRTTLIRVLPKGQEFVLNPEKRPRLFAEGALKMNAFSIFIQILNAHQNTGNTLLNLGLELQENLGRNWQQSTAETTAKIMLDWARHAKLAPGVFAETRKGPLKGWKTKEDRQIPLFSDG
jgi:hypothetical protein